MKKCYSITKYGTAGPVDYFDAESLEELFRIIHENGLEEIPDVDYIDLVSLNSGDKSTVIIDEYLCFEINCENRLETQAFANVDGYEVGLDEKGRAYMTFDGMNDRVLTKSELITMRDAFNKAIEEVRE